MSADYRPEPACTEAANGLAVDNDCPVSGAGFHFDALKDTGWLGAILHVNVCCNAALSAMRVVVI